MSFDDLMLRGIFSVLIILGGVQDWKRGEVTNWITIPLLIAGIIICGLNLSTTWGLVPVGLILVITIFFIFGGLAGADWKILVALLGAWPMAGFLAVLAAGIWGLVEMIRTHKRNVRFPGVTVYAFATALTFFIEVFTMSLINKV